MSIMVGRALPVALEARERRVDHVLDQARHFGRRPGRFPRARLTKTRPSKTLSVPSVLAEETSRAMRHPLSGSTSLSTTHSRSSSEPSTPLGKQNPEVPPPSVHGALTICPSQPLATAASGDGSTTGPDASGAASTMSPASAATLASETVCAKAAAGKAVAPTRTVAAAKARRREVFMAVAAVGARGGSSRW